MKNKLASFTLLELTISILLTTVVVSLGYVGWDLLQKQTISWRKKLVNMHEQMDVLTQLQHDVFAAVKLTQEEDNIIVCQQKEMPKNARYEFETERIIRHQATRVDTFTIPILSWNFKPVNEHNLLLEKIEVFLKAQDSLVSWTASKQYDAQKLMEDGCKN